MVCSDKTRQACTALMDEMQLPAQFIETVLEIYLPLARSIIEKPSSGPLLVSINGAQGTGKSTLTRFLKLLIEHEFQLRAAELSIDDFYYTREHRQQLAQQVHPLLATRGVPGTHDIDLLESSLATLMQQKDCRIPRFDKAADDRVEAGQWSHYEPGIDIILFEGWCNHSPFQDEASLLEPVNELEANEDPHAVWRQYVNEQLKQYHHRVFNQADMLLMLKAESFERVYDWRKLQEDKLHKQSGTGKNFIMNDDELKRFIQHYERITRHTLTHLPDKANIVLPVSGEHEIKRDLIRRVESE